MKEPSAEVMYQHINYFTKIYDLAGKEVNPIPKGVKVTVYCEADSERGFIYNETQDNLGFEALIAKSWMLQSELEDLLTLNQ